MKRENVQDIFALDSAQTAQLVHTLTPDTDDPGLIQVEFRVEGPVDAVAMDGAWNDALARHDALRLTVQMPKGKTPMMVLGKAASLTIEHSDLSDADPFEQDAALGKILITDRHRGLDVTACPAMRVTAVRLGPETCHYVWTCHHLFLDGWSTPLILRDILAFYRARCDGKPANLPPLPRLRDYFAALKSVAAPDSETTWRDYLAECPSDPSTRAVLAGVPWASSTPFRGDIPVSPELSDALQQAARDTKTTAAALIGVAWSMLLAAMADRRDVVFCKTVSGRNVDLPGVDRMAGSFTRAVPVRCLFEANETVADVAQRLHRQGFAMQTHEHLPFDRILEASGAGFAAFDTLLVVQNHPWEDTVSDESGVRMTSVTSEITSAFPLTLVATPGQELGLHFIAAPSLDSSAVAGLMAQLPDVLFALCAAPTGTGMAAVLDQIARPAARDRIRDMPRADVIDDMLTGRTRTPRTQTQMVVTKIWQDVLGVTEIDLEQDFVSLGGRSFAAMRILSRIEAEFGKRIPLVDFVRSPTIPALAQMVDGETETGTNHWSSLVPIQTTGTKPPIIFLHVAGSHVVFLRPLSKRLGADQPLFAFQPVGLEGERAPMTSFEEIAQHYVDELLQVQPSGPYYIVGHCAGARLSLEISHILRGQGHEIAALVVIDTPEPRPVLRGRQKFLSLLSQGRIDQIVMAGLRKFQPKPVGKTWEKWTKDLDDEKRTTVDNVERACVAADVRFHGRKHPGTLHLIRTEERAWKTFAWERFCDTLEVTLIPAQHVEMFFEPDVGHLADAIEGILNRARGARAAVPAASPNGDANPASRRA